MSRVATAVLARSRPAAGMSFPQIFLSLLTITTLSGSIARTAYSKPAPSSAPKPVPAAAKQASLVIKPVIAAGKEANPATPKPATAAIRRDLPAPRLLNRRTLLSRHALQFRGARYRYGAANARYTDCSGLTMQLYRKVGIRLPHSARSQYRHGKQVAKIALLPGDLVFFNTRGGISHVGMYIGDGRMIHAANPRRGVRIDSLNSPYYRRRYAGARRLLKEGMPVPEIPADAEVGNGEPPVYFESATSDMTSVGAAVALEE